MKELFETLDQVLPVVVRVHGKEHPELSDICDEVLNEALETNILTDSKPVISSLKLSTIEFIFSTNLLILSRVFSFTEDFIKYQSMLDLISN